MSATFQAFSVTHGAVVVAFLVITIAAILARKSLPDNGQRERLDRALAAAALLAWVLFTAWWLTPGKFDRQVSIPLHMCDVAGLFAVAALWTNRPRARVLLHFWGLGLSTQAFFTPVIVEGPARPEFWLFWACHGAIVGAALYDCFARGFRPRWRDAAFAYATCLIYLAVVLPLDLVFDLNYGYLGRGQPEGRTIVDALGPWPGRLGLLLLAVAAMFALQTLPWEWARRRRVVEWSGGGVVE